MSKKPNIESSEGETRHEYSDCCERCMSPSITKDVSKTADFDESGWFYPVSFTCQNTKCLHKWKEKFRVNQ